MKPHINRHTPRLWSASTPRVQARYVISFALILLQFFLVTSLVLADGTLSLDVNVINPTTPTVSTGQIVEYLIDFSCSSTSFNCGMLTINFTLDTELEFIEAIAPPGYTWNYNPATRTLTIVNNPVTNPTFDDGEAGQVTVRARVGQNLTDYRLEATVTGTITNGTGGGSTTINVPGPDLTILPPEGGWSLAKSKLTPADPLGPAEGGTATYELSACPTSPLGVARIDTIHFVDRFPEGAIVTVPNGGTVSDELPTVPGPNGINDTIRWTIDPVGSGPGGLWTANDGCITRTYTLQFPAASFPLASPINNTAYFSYATPDSYPPVPGPCVGSCAGTDGNGTTVSPPSATLVADKDGPGTSAIIAPGATNGTSVFILNWNLNQANADVEDLIVQDIFPTAFTSSTTPIINARQLSSGTWVGGYNALLQTFDGTTWTTRATPNGSTNITLNAPADFPDLIRGVRLVFTDPVPPGFAPVTRPSMRFIVPDGLDPANYDQDGAGPLQYREYQNCLSFSGTVAGGTFNPPASVCEAFRVGRDSTIGFANILTDKTSSPTEVFPLEEITFTLRLSLTQEASSDLINPTIEDVLPFGMQALRVTSVSFTNMLPGEQVLPYINIDTVPGTHPVTSAPVSLQRLRFYWANSVLPGTNYDLDGPAGSETFANPVPPTYNFSLLPDDDGAPVAGNPVSIARPDTGIKTITIVFRAMPRLDTPSGDNSGNQFTYTNTTLTVANSPNLVCQSGTTSTDSGDADGDGNTTETACTTGGNYRIREAAQMSSQKWIRSIVGPFDFRDSTNLNNPSPSCPIFSYDTTTSAGAVNFTRYPCVAQATQGGAIEYLLRIQNSGLVNVDDFILYDVLPHEGDVGVSQATAGQQRFSQFRTFLTGPIVIEAISKLPTGWPSPPTFVVEYNEVTPHNNSCRPEMSNTATIAPANHWQPGCNNTWTATPSSWGAVTNFRVRQTSGLIPPGAELIFSAPAIVSDQTIGPAWEAETGEIAWNNFAQRFRNAPSDRLLLTAEPRKVGVIVPEVYSIGNRVWIDNGGGAGGIAGDGILNGTEAGINGVEVQLWTRTRPNASSPYGAWTLYATDTTRADATKAAGTGDGFYFFGNLPGGTNREYRVLIPPTQFSPGPDATYGTADDAILATYLSSNYTGPDANTGAYQAAQTNARLDQRDNGRNPATFAGYTNAAIGGDGFPLGGVRTMEFQLTRGQTTSLATTGDQSTVDNANANVNLDNTNPDAGIQRNEGPFGRGQDYERNDYSDLTRDFGFFTPMSLGNRVWRDDGRDLSAPNNFNHPNFNNGVQDGDELGIAGVQVRLQRDINGDGDFNDPGEANFANTTTDANGFYIFDGLPPGNYRVLIRDLNFASGGPLFNLVSSYDGDLSRLPDNGVDRNDNGIDNANPAANGILSQTISLQPPGGEVTSETDLSGNAAAHGPQFRGRNGELNANSDLTIDFGFVNPPMSLGNRVWIDDGRTGPSATNPALFDDGILNGAELGVANVVVNLYFASNLVTPIATTTTDASGYYLFQYLPQGDYVVEIPSSNFQLGGPLYLHFSSTSVPAPVDATANNNDHGIDVASPTTTPVRSPIIQLRSNDEPTTEDAGNPTTNTAAGVGVFTGTGQPIDDNDSDLTVDFGFVRPVSIGNRVWLDDDSNGQLPGDGIRQATESGVNGVTVQLYLQGQTPGVDAPIASTVTANGGYYLFDRKGSNQADPNAARLGPGNYFVHIPASNFTGSGPLLGYVNSDNGPATNGGDTQIDSITGGGDENGQNTLVTTNPATYPSLTGVSSGIIALGYDVEPLNEADRDPTNPTFNGRDVEDGSSDLTIDFGFYRPRMSLGNRVWIDDGAGGGVFGDGIQNGGELGVANVVVNLYRDDAGPVGVPDTAPGAPIATTTTDANGYYIFDGLLPGRYIVAVAASNFASGGPLFEHGSSIGNYAAPTVGNARDDRRDNGIDNTDPTTGYGVISHSVNLALFSEPLNEAVGDLSGNPAHGPASIGNNAEVNINSNMTIDFGFVRYMSLGNRVWLDDGAGTPPDPLRPGFNIGYNNGLQDGTEVGINGVTVELYPDADSDGIPDGPAIATTITSGGGYYLFDGLRPGNYVVGIPTTNFDNVGDPLLGYDSSYDGDLSRLPTDTGADLNDNGIDVVNPSLNSILSRTINLTYDAEPTSEADLQASNPTALPGPFSRGRNNEANANSDLTIDFGFITPRMSLGNRVWIDDGAGGGVFGDGIQNGGELGVANVVVNLYRDANSDNAPDEPAASPFRTTTTDANGFYIFDNLSPGRYIVAVAPANFNGTAPLVEYGSSIGNYAAPTAANARDDRRDNGIDAIDPTNVSGYGVTSHVVTLALYSEPTNEAAGDLSGNAAEHGPGFIGRYGEFNANSNMTIDFGFVRYLSLGNRVWLDDGAGTAPDPMRPGFNIGYNNGLQDGTEVGINGVTVELYPDADSDGIPDGPAIATTITSGGGYYLFDGLRPGNYVVGIPTTNFDNVGDPLFGYDSSYDGDLLRLPTDTGADLNDNGIDVVNPSLNSILSRTINLTYDAEPTSEADLQASNPTALPGPFSRGRNNEADDNSDLTIDFGFITPRMSLGNRVWIDDGAGGGVFGDGIQNGGELGVAGVTVRLYRDANSDNAPDEPAASPFRTTTTDANGFYIFDNLSPGRYIVAVAPANFSGSGPLVDYGSSIGNYAAPTAANARDDRRDNGIDAIDPANPSGYGVTSHVVTLSLYQEPTNEAAADLSGNAADHGPGFIGRYGEFNANSNMTIDFGFVRYLSLGNRVWLDDGAGGGTRNNGVQDGAEVGINGVTVQLFAADGSGNPTGPVLQTAITSGGGYYLFDTLLPGDYVVVIPATNFQTGGALQTYNSSYDATGTRLPTDDGADRNDNGIDDNFPATNGIRSRAVTLAYNTEPTSETDLQAPSSTALPGPSSRGRNNEANINSDLTIDFGFVEPRYSLGNFVWYDHNNNGQYDTGLVGPAAFRNEQPVPDVTVRLYRSSGNDANGRGIPTTPLSSPFRTTTTDANGYYLFDDLPAGDYVIWIDALNFRSGPPPGPLFEYRSSTGVYSAPTVSNARLDTRDNGVDEANPVVSGVYSTTISITKNALPINEPDLSTNPTHGPAGERRGNFGQLDSDSDLTRDFGFYKPMSIGNRVWLDPNNNGIVDAGESGIANVRVELWEDADLDGTYETSRGFRTTSPSGHYLFDGLLPGNYIVVIPASNFASGGPLDGLNSSAYSGPDADAGNTAYVAPTTAGRLDNRDNGQPDNTAQFPDGVVSSEVQLRINSEPTGESDLTSGLGANGETNRNSNLTIDFGFVGDLLSLGNRVWLDPNNNGVQDAGENGIANVRVSLYRDVDNNGVPDGPAFATTLTDASGHYLFDNLPPGRYIVGLDNLNFGTSQPLNGLISSTGNYDAATTSGPPNLRDDRRDNGRDVLHPTFGLLSHSIPLARDAEPTGETDIGAQGPGAGGVDANSNLTIDFGLFRPLSIGNRVWLDNGGGALTNNGLQDVGEPGIAGVTLLLYRYIGAAATPTDYTTNPTDYAPVLDASSLPRSSTTDANGYYLFDGLGQGTYVVVVAPSNFASGGPLENFNNSTPTFATPADRNDNGINNGSPATLGIASNPVALTLGGAPTGETDLSGNTAAHGPNSRGRNGEADNNSNLTIDFGFIPTTTLSLGNRVWIDEGAGPNARNGILDPGENGAANVRVSLYFDSNNDGIPDGPPIASTLTDANGYYLFDNLAPGRYIVGLDASNFNGTGPLVGYGSSPGAYSDPTVGNTRDDNRDNGIDNPSPNLGTGLLSHSILLAPGAQPTNEAPGDIGPQGEGAGGVNANSNLTIDFGLYRPLSIGNRVWFDNGPGAQTNNGLQDAGEPGIPNVFVELYAADSSGQRTGLAIATTVTDAGGYYLFDGLLPGEYVVYIPPVNFGGTGALVGLTNSEPTNPDALTGEQNVDRNDNGINDATPAANGIASNRIVLAYGSMPTNETDLSGNAPAHGPNSRGRNGEANANSNLTVDFGFFLNDGVRMSLGNRVWLDNGAGGGTANDGFQNGTEPGVDGVSVQLFADANGDGIPDSATPLATTTTTGGGYYLFDNLLPGRYVVVIPASNFASGGPLYGTLSSTGAYTTPTSGTRDDQRDNGVDAVNPAVGGVRSGTIQLVLGNETTGEADVGPQGTGLDANGNPILDENSNLTIDFGFVTRYDWGDAPDTGAAFTFTNGNPANYGTSSANGGPSHRIVSNLYMGSRVDAENDGQPNATADGDDANGTPDDEDGVRFPPLVPGLPADVEVTVFNNTGQSATLIGWIDFDGSGTFDPGEAVSITVPSSPSPQIVILTFNVPIGSDLPAATDGTTFARFRLSTDSSLTTSTPGGAVNDGEVEDYRVTINAPGVYIQKTDGRNSIVVGQSTTYTITIRNSPSAPAISGRPFQDDLDPRFTNVSWTCTATNASCITGQAFGTGASGTGNVALSLDLAPGGQIVITINATLRADVVPPPDTLVNQAIFLPDQAEDVNGIIFDPPLGQKTGVHLGNNVIRWTMVWFNTGLAQAATITDTLPASQTFAGNLNCVAFGNPPGQSVTTGCDFNPATRQIVWTGTIGQGNANRIEISFDVTVPGDGNYNNVATLTTADNQQAAAAAAVVIGDADAQDGQSSNAAPGVILVDPAIVKLVNPRLALPGETITWTITVTNPNAVAVDNVVVVENMPSEFIIDSITATRGTVTRSGQRITINLGTMQPAEQVNIVVQTRLNPRAVTTSSVTNVAVLQAPYDKQARATIDIISRLPETGEAPLWRDGLLLALGLGLALLSLGAAWRVRAR